MIASIEFDKPNEIKATISITLTMKQWMELKEELKGAPYYGGAQDLRSAINDLTMKTCTVISYSDGEDNISA